MGAVNRNPEFWENVIGHPDVWRHVTHGHAIDVAAMLANPAVTPIAGVHGGYWFIRLDVMGFAYELHSMFTPEGWGREASEVAKEAFTDMFASGAAIITTMEDADNPRSKPPKSFGFREAGPFRRTQFGNVRPWVLTFEGWNDSPARRRLKCH